MINLLEDSTNYNNTYSVIAQLSQVTHWTNQQVAKLTRIARENDQVKCILKDDDVRRFYVRVPGTIKRE